MRRIMRGLAILGFLCVHLQTLSAQSATCDKDCQRAKLDELFKKMDDASAVRPKPGDPNACSIYKGIDSSDAFIDICSKLKYVRSLAAGTATNFSCPTKTATLIGLPATRIRHAWGEPDFMENARSVRSEGSRAQIWTYFVGSPRPGWQGGGFPEVSLQVVDGRVAKEYCALSK